jgi:protein TonB
VLAHGLAMVPSPAPTTAIMLEIPAPELAVALAPGRETPAVSRPEPIPLTQPATGAAQTEPPAAAVPAPSTAEASVNHLYSLLHESLNRHFIYPPVAHRNGWEGRVELLVRLDPEGRLHALRIVQSSGYALLDEDALLTLQRIGTIPAARAWLPEQGYTTKLPVVYRLTKG